MAKREMSITVTDGFLSHVSLRFKSLLRYIDIVNVKFDLMKLSQIATMYNQNAINGFHVNNGR